ncbi:MAG: UbiH/UbiF/VisC/COQ6 family ubiquinone biosynthesis hydroxylase [Halioglobus sp.]
MLEKSHFDVTVVGAGIAGSALAVALSGNGLSVLLLEAQPLAANAPEPATGVAGFDARVSALTPRSQSLLEQLGVWPSIVGQRLCPYTHMTVWDAEGTGMIEFDCGEVDVPVLGHIVENRVIVSALIEQVRRCPDITLLNPVRLSDCRALEAEATGYSVDLDNGTVITTDLLVAADGALSRVREMLDFKTREWDYGHRAIVTTVQLENAHQGTAWQRFLPSGPLAFLPLPGTPTDHYCSIVWSVDEDVADDLMALDTAAFCEQLQQAFEARLGTVITCSERFCFPLRQRHAVDYVQSGIALVGDAAHTIHPLAGQGINLGLADVLVLAEELIAESARGGNLGSLESLKRYQRRRKGENLAMMAAMDGFKYLFAQRALPIRWLRNAGMRSVGRAGMLKKQLMRHAMGLG